MLTCVINQECYKKTQRLNNGCIKVVGSSYHTHFFFYIRKSHQTELFTTIFSFLPGDFIARVDPDKKDCCIVDIYCSNIIYTPLQ